MLISVAMTTHNGVRFLEEQLESLTRQTRLPDELVVFDDHSQDQTTELLRKFAARAPFDVRLEVNERRLGSTATFERAIAACDGKIIITSDQDDVWLPRKVETVERVFETEPGVDLVFSDAHLIDEDGRRLGKRLWGSTRYDQSFLAQLNHDPLSILLDRTIVSGCTLAIRARARDLILPFPPAMIGDQPVVHDQWISLALPFAAGVRSIREPLLEYRMHPAQQIGIRYNKSRRVIPMWLWPWRRLLVPRHRIVGQLRLNLALLELAEERLTESSMWRDSRAQELLEGSLEHLRGRLSLPERRWKRVRAVIAGLRTGTYQRSPGGIADAVIDATR